MTKRIYLKLAFSPNPYGHGGERRSHQVEQLFVGEFSVTRFDVARNVFPHIVWRLWSGLVFLVRHRLPLRNLTHIGLTGFRLTNARSLFKEAAEGDIVVWEPMTTYADSFLPFLCKDLGLRIVVFPHNVESLVHDEEHARRGSRFRPSFEHEVSVLRACDCIVTISLEELWLLGLYGIDALYLPYVLSADQAARMRSIRARRVGPSAENGPFLMLGSYMNPPTKHGIERMIEFWSETCLDQRLLIAGFGTEEICSRNLPPNVEVLGAVPDSRLDEVLVECRALIVYQPPSTGALTRLAEMRVAGVPVIANSTSLRSFQNVPGFYSFFDLQDVGAMLQRDLCAPEEEVIEVDYAASVLRRVNQIEL